MSLHEPHLASENPGHVSATQACLDQVHEREHAMCLVCGHQNPNGLKLKFKVQPDGSVGRGV